MQEEYLKKQKITTANSETSPHFGRTVWRAHFFAKKIKKKIVFWKHLCYNYFKDLNGKEIGR